MLNINPYQNVKTFYNPKNNYNQTQISPQNRSYSNLRLLAKDTISFSGESFKLNRALLEAIDNVEVCKKLHDDAQAASQELDSVLKDYLKDYVSTDEKENIIYKIENRVKSPESIREKAVSAFQAASRTNKLVPNTLIRSDVMKEYLHDVIGERIIMQNTDKKEGDLIIDGLIRAIDDRKLKIVKIENYCPKDLDKDLEYFSKEKLEQLQEKVKENGGHAEMEVNSKSTGYMALHIDVDLSDREKYANKPENDDYFAEIQIVGKDVAELKEVEDFCYKLKAVKDIKCNNVNYKPFAEYFKKYYTDELKDTYNEYTTKAYLAQRKKKSDDKTNLLPTIRECGFADEIPIQLDFNVLKTLKNYCDKITAFQENVETAKAQNDEEKIYKTVKANLD